MGCVYSFGGALGKTITKDFVQAFRGRRYSPIITDLGSEFRCHRGSQNSKPVWSSPEGTVPGPGDDEDGFHDGCQFLHRVLRDEPHVGRWTEGIRFLGR